MGIDVVFHFKRTNDDLDFFANELNKYLGVDLERSNNNSWLGNFLNFGSCLYENKDYQNDEYDWIEYDTIFMLSSSYSQDSLIKIQEICLLSIAYSICYFFKISGNIVSDDGYNWGKIGYKDEKIINFDIGEALIIPQMDSVIPYRGLK